ncbi:DUF7215 family protein [Streptomyces griseoincarnatus]
MNLQEFFAYLDYLADPESDVETVRAVERFYGVRFK